MPRHLVTEYGPKDHQAARRAGIDPPRDWDHGEKYDGESALWPAEVEYFVGDCPTCGAPMASNGVRFACVFDGNHR
jgi:hypothetical protein